MSIIGVVDYFRVNYVSGWVYKVSTPGAHLVVSAMLDGKVLGSTVANGFRRDLKNANIGKGDHAYLINFQPPINEADAGKLTVTATTVDGSERKDLPPPNLRGPEIAPGEASKLESTEWMQEKIRKFLKYGSLYSQSNPIDPPTGYPTDFADSIDSWNTREISYYLSRINVSVDQAKQDIGKDSYAIPSSNNREGYAAGRDLAYWISGYAEYTIIENIARLHGVGGGRYFDFGGSTGRIFRHFALQSDAWDVWSCDFKETSVAFNLKYFPSKARAFLNTSFPSLPLPDGYFDLVSACSVFTHINEAETSWLLELRRILKIGGIACITILNDDTWGEMDVALREMMESLRPDIANAPTLPEGKTVLTFRDDDPYNCNVLHSNNYIRQNWGRFFEICDIMPRYLNTQAMVVCRRLD